MLTNYQIFCDSSCFQLIPFRVNDYDIRLYSLPLTVIEIFRLTIYLLKRKLYL
jgi:hypothetical protein